MQHSTPAVCGLVVSSNMQFHFAGLMTLRQASSFQTQGTVLGFECVPTVSLGVRGNSQDLLWPEEKWREMGFAVERADRGGQATIHNPGQLVIFPCLDVRPWGARNFVDSLIKTSQKFLLRRGVETSCRKSEPGLYTARGKIMSIGLRIHRGVAHHGIAINVRNDLEPFQGIRVCGKAAAPVDRLGQSEPLAALFSSWTEEFKAQLTSKPISTNLGFAISDVRS